MLKLNFHFFTIEHVRDKEWASIAAVHRRKRDVTTWSFHRSTMGEHKLSPLTSVKDLEQLTATVRLISLI